MPNTQAALSGLIETLPGKGLRLLTTVEATH